MGELVFVSGMIGFFLCLLCVLVAIYLVKRDVKKKKLDLEKKMGFSMENLQSALQGNPSDK